MENPEITVALFHGLKFATYMQSGSVGKREQYDQEVDAILLGMNPQTGDENEVIIHDLGTNRLWKDSTLKWLYGS